MKKIKCGLERVRKNYISHSPFQFNMDLKGLGNSKLNIDQKWLDYSKLNMDQNGLRKKIEY